MNEYELKYPIGEFEKPKIITDEMILDWIKTIEKFSQYLAKEVDDLTSVELKYKYRPNGWNIQQIVHHSADSHLNSFIRFKLTLTEDKPRIRPYFEDRWAELPDTLSASITDSIKIIEGLHSRWTILLKNLSVDDLERTFFHPEANKVISLKENIGIYAWHCKHHLEHIRVAKLNEDKYK